MDEVLISKEDVGGHDPAEGKRTRTRLINRLAAMLDKADSEVISNNDLRRLMTVEDFSLAARVLRRLTEIPDGGGIFNIAHAFRTDHLGFVQLYEYGDPRMFKKLSTTVREEVEQHLHGCELCTAQMRFFRFNCDRIRVVPGKAPEGHQGTAIGDLDGLHTGPVSLNSTAIGWVPSRDDV